MHAAAGCLYEEPAHQDFPMIYPPDIQRRLAVMSRLSSQEQFDLHCDIVSFAKKEVRTHGRMRPDAFPDQYPPTREDVEEMRSAFLFNRPLVRFLLGFRGAIRRWVRRKRRDVALAARSS